MTLVELMVGTAVGLIVLSGVITMSAGQLAAQRRLQLQTQVQQDLRRTAELVAREFRRAGHWSGATTAGMQPVVNPLAALTHPAPGEVGLRYSRSPTQDGPFGFRLQSGVLRTRLGGAGWQDLSDGTTLRLTRFDVDEAPLPAQPLSCPRRCADGGTGCWPRLQARLLRVTLEGHAVHDPALRERVALQVRVRNDALVPGPTGIAAECP